MAVSAGGAVVLAIAKSLVDEEFKDRREGAKTGEECRNEEEREEEVGSAAK